MGTLNAFHNDKSRYTIAVYAGRDDCCRAIFMWGTVLCSRLIIQLSDGVFSLFVGCQFHSARSIWWLWQYSRTLLCGILCVPLILYHADFLDYIVILCKWKTNCSTKTRTVNAGQIFSYDLDVSFVSFVSFCYCSIATHPARQSSQ